MKNSTEEYLGAYTGIGSSGSAYTGVGSRNKLPRIPLVQLRDSEENLEHILRFNREDTVLNFERILHEKGSSEESLDAASDQHCTRKIQLRNT